MERLTSDSIKNLFAMSKYEYHNYETDIKAALSEVKEYRAIVSTPEEVAALKAENDRLRAERDAAVGCIEDINYQNRKFSESWIDEMIDEWRGHGGRS